MKTQNPEAQETRSGEPQVHRATSPVETDVILSKLVDQARQALLDIAKDSEIGQYQECKGEAPRVVSHYFTCNKAGYVGWRWCVTMSRVPRSRTGSICEMVLMPGEGALLAPKWVPWSERLAPGDLDIDDVLPFKENDPYLMEGYEATGEEEADRLANWELGLGRPRVLNDQGRSWAAKRWTRARGPRHTQDSEHICANCGYLTLLAGALRTQIGVCANEWSPNDGMTVALNHSCGAHSQTDESESGHSWQITPPKIDETDIEVFERS